MTHLSLFSGIGGLDLAAEAAGFTTVGQCEWADYPTKVLEKHWPDVPRWRDIRTLTGEDFHARTGLRTVDVISGGFPCQPFSVAGKQKGKRDERYLWPEMLRVVRELTPRWVVGENVPGILRIAAGDVVSDLEREGYDVAVFDFEAASIGALHRRERVAFVANTGHVGRERWNENAKSPERAPCAVSESRGRSLADSDTDGLQRRNGAELQECPGKRASGSCGSQSDIIPDAARAERNRQVRPSEPTGGGRFAIRGWWTAEPDVGRVANGIPARVDRLKCLGNAVVPQQFYPIFKAIYETEGHFT